MKKFKLTVNTKSKNYSIVIGRDLVKNINSILKKEKIFFNKCLLIIDKKIPKKFIGILKKKLSSKKIILYNFLSSEKNKNYQSVSKILNLLFQNNFNREDCVISIGGGIVGDVSGFAASIYKRGIKFVNIPSTLLSQVDSSIGGKTGINNNYGKNQIGTFYQPDIVLSDISLLASLPKREILCGYGEILKHSLISSEKNFIFLNKNQKKIFKLKHPLIEKTIYESCKIKANVVQKDEREKNLRKVLNLGHTFAHSFEASLQYSKKLNHGEAVILGIKNAVNFSYENNILNKKDHSKIIQHIENINFNKKLKNFFKKRNVSKIINFMQMDKKNKSNRINLILLKKIGKPILNLNFNSRKISSFLQKKLT